MRRSLILWDIDGTLLLTSGAGMRGMARAGRKLYGDTFRWDGVSASGRLDPLILEDALARNGLAPSEDGHRRFHDTYLLELAEELERVGQDARALPGIQKAIAALLERGKSQRDVVQGIVTGNYAGAAPLKLRACGIDPAWFEIGAFGDEGRTRPDLVALALRRCHERLAWRPEPRHVIVVGDTPHDIECAHAHGCIAFAVATGLHSAEDLRAAGADVVVQDLSDPQALFDLLAPSGGPVLGVTCVQSPPSHRGAAMSEPNAAHVHHAIDYIEFTVTDVSAAKKFYTAAFGWSFNDYGPDYAGIRGPGREVGGLRKDQTVRAGGPLVVLFSQNLETTLAKVREAGGRIAKEPYPFPGGRRFHFTDPSGNELAVWAER